MAEVRLTDLNYLRDLMARYGIYTKKKYGQNFLINASVPQKIALIGCPNDTCGVLEIGPGMGTLTFELCKRAGKVAALEIDETLLPVLAETLSGFDNVTVLHRDVLKTDLAALCAEQFSGCSSVCVCANLPYYITTPVLMRLLESGAPFSQLTLMVQKEVADRITAKEGSPEYGAITAAVAYYGKAEKVFSVSPGSFFPAPKVESCVMRITLYPESPYADCDKDLLFRLMKAAFGQRRKTLKNTLRGVLSENQLSLAVQTLESIGFSGDVRGEKLSVGHFAVLCRALQNAAGREKEIL